MPRGSAPGGRRGGRKKGTPNRRTTEVTERLAALGCDPIEGMARLAMDQTKSPELCGRMFSELAGFVAPKRRAVEHTGADGGPIETRERAGQLDYSRLSLEELRTLRELVVKATPEHGAVLSRLSPAQRLPGSKL
jgi:hypothetical protein